MPRPCALQSSRSSPVLLKPWAKPGWGDGTSTQPVRRRHGGGHRAARVKTGNADPGICSTAHQRPQPLLSRTSHTGKLADDLQKADLKLKSSEWALAVVGLGILVGLLVAFRYGSPIAFSPARSSSTS